MSTHLLHPDDVGEMPVNQFAHLGVDADLVPQGSLLEDPATSTNMFSHLGVDYAPPTALPSNELEWSDHGRQIAAGFTGMESGLGWLIKKSGNILGFEGIGRFGQAIQSQGDRFTNIVLNEKIEWLGITQEGLSPAARRALETDFIGDGAFGDKWNKAKLMVAGSLPGTATGMGIGALVTKGLIRGLVKAGLSAKAATAAGSIVGMSAGEAGVASPTAGAGVESEILAMSHDQLLESYEYVATLAAMSDEIPEDERREKARQAIADAASGNAAALTGITTFLLSAPFGQTLARLTRAAPGARGGGRLGNALRGGGAEASQEFLQSGAEAISGNVAMRGQGIDVDIFEDAFEEAFGGMVSGFMMGAPLGAMESSAPSGSDGGSDLQNELQRIADAGAAQKLDIAKQAARDQVANWGGDALEQELAAAGVGVEMGNVLDQYRKKMLEEMELADFLVEQEEGDLLRAEGAAVVQAEAQERFEKYQKEQAFGEREEEQAALKEIEAQAAVRQREEQRIDEGAAAQEKPPTLEDVTPQEVKDIGKPEKVEPAVPESSFAIISAERDDLTTEENAARTIKLAERLEAEGVPIISAEGMYKGSGEASFIIATTEPALLDKARNIAKEFGQESILIVDQNRSSRFEYTKDKSLEELGVFQEVSSVEGVDAYTRVGGKNYVSAPLESTQEPGRTQPPAADAPAPTEALEAVEAVVSEVAEDINPKLTTPTEAQIEAENTKVGRLEGEKIGYPGIDMSIENTPGSLRGAARKVSTFVGRILGTKGADWTGQHGHIDSIIKAKPTGNRIFVIDQVDPQTGQFDEHKVMFGFKNEADAARGHKQTYTAQGDMVIGAITEMSLKEFKSWAYTGDMVTNPVGKLKQPKRTPKGKRLRHMVNVADDITIEQITSDTTGAAETVIRLKSGKRASGSIRLTDIGNNTLQVTSAIVPDRSRLQGRGQRLIVEALKEATRQGKTLVSDKEVSVDQLRAYESLRRQGFEIDYGEHEAEVMSMLRRHADKANPTEGLGVRADPGTYSVRAGERPVVKSIQFPKGQDIRYQLPEGGISKTELLAEEGGEPMTVYHGTQASFDEFEKGDIGFHFGTQEQANSRLPAGPDMTAEIKAGVSMAIINDTISHLTKGSQIRPAYLKLTNPLKTADAGAWDSAQEAHRAIRHALGKKLRAEFDKLFPADANGFLAVKELAWEKNMPQENDQYLEAMKIWLEEAGYDGIVYDNKFEAAPKTVHGLRMPGKPSYIVFRPEQVVHFDEFGLAYMTPKERIEQLIGEFGMSVAEAERILAPLLAMLPLLASHVKIVSTPHDAHPEILSAMQRGNGLASPGVYDHVNNTVWIFTANISTTETLISVLFHEGVAHFGTRALLGDKFDSVMDSIHGKVKNKAAYAEVFTRYKLDSSELEDRREGADEYVAWIAQQIAEGKQNIDVSLLDEVVAAIREVLRSLGLISQWSDNDIKSLLRDSRSGISGIALEKLMLTTPIQMAETGELFDLEEPASVVLKRMRQRSGVVEKLRGCL